MFFAAWPAPEIQRQLGGLAHDLKPECGGRAIPTRNIHLTLVFLGNVARERRERIELLAAGVTAPPFDLEVDRVEYWRHNRIVWAGVKHCPPALADLVSRLEQALLPEGFQLERRAYVPHITLLRDARRAPSATAAPAVSWPVRRYALMESASRDRGRAYEMLREWPLTA